MKNVRIKTLNFLENSFHKFEWEIKSEIRFPSSLCFSYVFLFFEFHYLRLVNFISLFGQFIQGYVMYEQATTSGAGEESREQRRLRLEQAAMRRLHVDSDAANNKASASTPLLSSSGGAGSGGGALYWSAKERRDYVMEWLLLIHIVLFWICSQRILRIGAFIV